ncbi:MAG: hypothetical protein ACE5JR_04625 [Gemmatimonadota bacterium]
MAEQDWTVIRVQGDRGMPSINGLQFLSCLAAVRDTIGDRRWHYRWVPYEMGRSVDGLRVEIPYDSKERHRLVREVEFRVPPPDGLLAEPVRWTTDLDGVQSAEEVEDCLTLLWRWSDFLADLRIRNPRASVRSFTFLTSGAFLFFVTGDRRHLDRALESNAFSSVPPVSMGRVVELVRAEPMPYRVPPSDRSDAVNGARIHHLAACTFAAAFYPFTTV